MSNNLLVQTMTFRTFICSRIGAKVEIIVFILSCFLECCHQHFYYKVCIGWLLILLLIDPNVFCEITNCILHFNLCLYHLKSGPLGQLDVNKFTANFLLIVGPYQRLWQLCFTCFTILMTSMYFPVSSLTTRPKSWFLSSIIVAAHVQCHHEKVQASHSLFSTLFMQISSSLIFPFIVPSFVIEKDCLGPIKQWYWLHACTKTSL